MVVYLSVFIILGLSRLRLEVFCFWLDPGWSVLFCSFLTFSVVTFVLIGFFSLFLFLDFYFFFPAPSRGKLGFGVFLFLPLYVCSALSW